MRVRYSHRLYDWQRGRTSTERRAWYAHWLLTSGPHAKEVRLFGLGELFRGMYSDLRRVLRTERIGIAKRRAAADFAAGALAVLAIFGTFAYIVWETIIGAISLGSMVMYYQAFQTGLTSLQAVLGGMAGLYEDNLFLTYYHEFMALEPRVLPPAQPAPVPRPMSERRPLRGRRLRLPGHGAPGARRRHPRHPPRRGRRPGRPQRLRQDHARQAPVPALRPHGRRHHPRRHPDRAPSTSASCAAR